MYRRKSVGVSLLIGKLKLSLSFTRSATSNRSYEDTVARIEALRRPVPVRPEPVAFAVAPTGVSERTREAIRKDAERVYSAITGNGAVPDKMPPVKKG